MRRNRMLRVLRVALIVVLAVAVFSFAVMGLWNWLMTGLFGLRAITFWQAFGLLVLSKILFGGFRGGPGHGVHWRHRMTERWARMSPEERENFRRGLRAGAEV